MMGASRAVAFSQNSPLIKRLIEAGIIPRQCLSFELSIRVDRPVTIRVEHHAMPEEIDAIVNAIADDPEAAAQIAREIVFKDRPRNKGVQVSI